MSSTLTRINVAVVGSKISRGQARTWAGAGGIYFFLFLFSGKGVTSASLPVSVFVFLDVMVVGIFSKEQGVEDWSIRLRLCCRALRPEESALGGNTMASTFFGQKVCEFCWVIFACLQAFGDLDITVSQC